MVIGVGLHCENLVVRVDQLPHLETDQTNTCGCFTRYFLLRALTFLHVWIFWYPSLFSIAFSFPRIVEANRRLDAALEKGDRALQNLDDSEKRR